MAQSEIILGGLPFGADIVVGEELEVGTFTINGVTYSRYIKVVDFGALPNNTTEQKTKDFTYVGIINIGGWAYRTDTNSTFPLPHIGLDDSNNIIFANIWIQDDKITILDNFNLSSFYGYLVIEYYR